MILACGPSGPELLLLVAVFFGLPVISLIGSVVGITGALAAKRGAMVWIAGGIAFLCALPGACFLGNAIMDGNRVEPLLFLYGGGPIALASVALLAGGLARRPCEAEKVG